MKKIIKRAAMSFLALSVATASFAIVPQKAEAFSLGGLAGGLLNAFSGGKDVNSAHKKMLENFYYSTALLSAAYQNIKIATDDSIANKELITKEQAAKSAVKTSDAGLNMKNGADQNKRDAEHMKKYLAEALESGDEEKLKQIDSFVKAANDQRLLSDIMAGVSYTQIGLITASQVKGALSGNIGNIANIIAIAQETEGLLKVRGELSNLLKSATEEYRKSRGIKDPSKKEQKAAAKEIEKG